MRRLEVEGVDCSPDTQGLRCVRWRRCTRGGQLFETVKEAHRPNVAVGSGVASGLCPLSHDWCSGTPTSTGSETTMRITMNPGIRGLRRSEMTADGTQNPFT